MHWIGILLMVVAPLPLIIFLICLLPYFRKRNKNYPFAKLIYHIRKHKQLDFQNVFTFIVPNVVCLFLLFECVRLNFFSVDFLANAKVVLQLFPTSLVTPTIAIAVLGPSILSLNYNLFKANVYETSKEFKNFYTGIYLSREGRFIDAQLDHTHQLNSLVIAWGAFAYEIITLPQRSLASFELAKLKIENLSPCLEQGFKNCTKEPFYEALNLIETDFVSLVIITIALGFISWMLIRLISGQLSGIDVVDLYLKDKNKKYTNPPISSRITLYRYVLVFFSFLYLVWVKYYLLIKAKVKLDKYGCNDALYKSNVSDIISDLGIPNLNSGYKYIIFVAFAFFLFLSIIIGSHYLANFRYNIKSRLKQERDQIAKKNEKVL